MIYDENYMILDEDEDLDLLLEDEEILNEIGFVKNIKSAKDIDSKKTLIKLVNVKKKYNKLIASGKYRAYKSSDRPALEKAINSSEFKKSIAGLISPTNVARVIRNKIKLNSFGYSVFKYDGLTLLSCYRKNEQDANIRLTRKTNRLKPVRGSNYVYMIMVKTETGKVVLKRISVYGVRNKASNRLESNL